MKTALTQEEGNSAGSFPTTRWGLILGGKGPGPEDYARKPLGEICQMYWRPVLTFIRRQGYAAAEAQDLTQDFFVTILEGKILHSADPGRGRFRCLLLRSLKNFLIDAAIRGRTQKRGGSATFVQWDDWNENALGQTNGAAPESLFDVGWAVTIAEEALRRLAEECESQGHGELYRVLSPYLDADRAETCYRTLSVQLGVDQKLLKRLLHEFRKRFRTLLREEVEKTMGDDADVEDEIRYLCAALSSIRPNE